MNTHTHQLMEVTLVVWKEGKENKNQNKVREISALSSLEAFITWMES